MALLLGCNSRTAPTPNGYATPENTTIRDSDFEPYPNARAYSGQNEGSAYQIEMPDNWNGNLVLYLRGSYAGPEDLYVEQPAIRAYLIRHGYAWAASSFDRNRLITGLAADQTAHLLDLFSEKFREPRHAFLLGGSMGGGGALIAAERYGDRFAGAVAYCAMVDPLAAFDADGDALIAAAYATGITQSEFDSTDVETIFSAKIAPALNDPSIRARFESTWVALSGGVRPLALVGLHAFEPVLWDRAVGTMSAGLFDNESRVYSLMSGPLTSDEFNRAAVRIPGGQARARTPSTELFGGMIAVPVITIAGTGDANVTLSQQQTIARRVEASGKEELLVQRLVQDADHCGVLNRELEESFDALVGWVETGERPPGEDLLVQDLSQAGLAFTRVPRPESSLARFMPTANERLTLSGHVTRDGERFSPAALSVVVIEEGRVTVCSYSMSPVLDGNYVRVVAPNSEMPGCGGPGAQIRLMTQLATGSLVVSAEWTTWPVTGHEVTFDANFKSQEPEYFDFYAGELFDSEGHRLPSGTSVQATVRGRLCATATVPPVGRGADGYFLVISRSLPNCSPDLGIEFSVNDAPARIVSELGHDLDLMLP